jgi:ATP-dependent Clp protease protease subunit
MEESTIDLKVDTFFNHGVDVRTRTIYVGSTSEDEDGESGTDFRMAERFIKSLHLIKSLSKSRAAVNVLMNNIGGDESHGFAMYDAIRAIRLPVNITVFGSACSMGSIILQAATKRVMARNATMLLHYGETTVSGHGLNVERWVAYQKKLNENMEQIYLEKIKQKIPSFTLERLREMIRLDCILTAKEALNFGLIDEVL